MASKYLDPNGLLYFWQKIKAAFVAQESGKALSSNDFTDSLKNKLEGIDTGAQTNVQADWNVSDASSDAFIKNKPTIPEGVIVDSEISSSSANPVQNSVIYTALGNKVDKISGKGLSTNDYTTTEKNKLAGIDDNANNYSHPSYTAYTGKPTDNQSPTFGGTFNISQVVSDTSGHVSQILDYTVTIPGSAASTTASGLMTATDKIKLNKLVFDSNDLIDSSILPSYVDDVIEAYARSGQTALSSTWLATGSASGTVITPETGKIYVLMAKSGDYTANSQFRWGGTAYVKLNDGGVSAITNSEIDTIVSQ